MDTSAFVYDLPPELIAQEAAEPRDSARLLVAHGDAAPLHRHIRDLGDYLRPGDLLVLNRTRVIPARFEGRKESGGAVEVLLVHPLEQTSSPTWRCLIGGKVRVGTRIELPGLQVEVIALHDDGHRDVGFPSGTDVLAYAEQHGHVPLPPYIARPDRPHDRERYQTVFADRPGSVAAPTASLHLTTALLEQFAANGVERAFVNLAIGPGTFKPVDTERIEDYQIHAEHAECPPETIAAVNACRARGGRVIAVGTTVVRTLETAARQPGGFAPYQGWTQLFLYPPQRLHIVDCLLTNFHLPRSSLLMLIACHTGVERLHALYAEAVNERYRFFSYGDAMLLLGQAGAFAPDQS